MQESSLGIRDRNELCGLTVRHSFDHEHKLQDFGNLDKCDISMGDVSEETAHAIVYASTGIERDDRRSHPDGLRSRHLGRCDPEQLVSMQCGRRARESDERRRRQACSRLLCVSGVGKGMGAGVGDRQLVGCARCAWQKVASFGERAQKWLVGNTRCAKRRVAKAAVGLHS
eukprot:6193822-Pleurochrysis_carterae.AAC.2